MPCQWEKCSDLPRVFSGTRFLENLCLDCLHMFNHNTKKFHHLDPLGSVHNTTRIVRMAPPSPIGGSCCQEIPLWAWHDTRLAGLTRRCSIEDHGMLRWFPCDAGACDAQIVPPCLAVGTDSRWAAYIGREDDRERIHGFHQQWIIFPLWCFCAMSFAFEENGRELFHKKKGQIGMEGFTTLPVLGIDKPGIVVI